MPVGNALVSVQKVYRYIGVNGYLHSTRPTNIGGYDYGDKTWDKMCPPNVAIAFTLLSNQRDGYKNES